MKHALAASLLVVATISGALLGDRGDAEREVQMAEADMACRTPTRESGGDVEGSERTASATPEQEARHIAHDLNIIVPPDEISVSGDASEFVFREPNGLVFALVAVHRSGSPWRISSLTSCIAGPSSRAPEV
jgi:hypothetical protein